MNSTPGRGQGRSVSANRHVRNRWEVLRLTEEEGDGSEDGSLSVPHYRVSWTASRALCIHGRIKHRLMWTTSAKAAISISIFQPAPAGSERSGTTAFILSAVDNGQHTGTYRAILLRMLVNVLERPCHRIRKRYNAREEWNICITVIRCSKLVINCARTHHHYLLVNPLSDTEPRRFRFPPGPDKYKPSARIVYI